MQRPAKRNSSLKALQAIKENSTFGGRVLRSKKALVDLENVPPPSASMGGTKRHSSPSACLPPNPKRKTFGDITNAVLVHSTNVSNGKKGINSDKKQPSVVAAAVVNNDVLPKRRSARLKGKSRGSSSSSRKGSSSPHDCSSSMEEDNQQSSSLISEDTPITIVQNILKATSLSDECLKCNEVIEEVDRDTSTAAAQSKLPVWKDIDEAEAHDSLFSSEYAPEIYEYMKRREIMFTVEPYLDTQPFINANMRTILVDWLVEVQENFELFHETLYLAVKIVDRYLERKEVKKEYLQLVGATAMLVASKFEELSPPLVDDFIYLCDDAYTHSELLKMECDILCTMDYDLNAPVAYRFLRRYARAAEADLQTHTLARYICESTLQEYEFVPDRPSLIAAASMYMAIRMKKLGTWTPTLRHYSGYTIDDMIPMLHRLNDLICRPPPAVGTSNASTPTITSTVRGKYSHSVFFEVALIPPLENIDTDASMAKAELKALQS